MTFVAYWWIFHELCDDNLKDGNVSVSFSFQGKCLHGGPNLDWGATVRKTYVVIKLSQFSALCWASPRAVTTNANTLE